MNTYVPIWHRRVAKIALMILPALSAGTVYAVDLASLERDIVSKRESFKDAVLHVTGSVSFESGKRKGTARHLDATVYLNDVDEIRVDKLETRPILGYGDEQTASSPYKRKIVRANDHILTYCDKVFTTGVTIMPELYNRPDVDGELFFIADPRLVGLWPSSYGNLAHQNMRTLFCNDAWTVQQDSVSIMNIDEGELISATYKSRGGSVAEVNIICFRDGQCDVKELRVQNGEHVWHVVTEFANVPGFGQFPSAVDYKWEQAGELKEVESLDIEVTSINTPNAKELFTFAGLGVPLGTKVGDHTGEEFQDLELTAEGLKPYTAGKSKADLSASNNERPHWKTVAICANAAVIGLLGLVLLYRGFATRWSN